MSDHTPLVHSTGRIYKLSSPHSRSNVCESLWRQTWTAGGIDELKNRSTMDLVIVLSGLVSWYSPDCVLDSTSWLITWRLSFTTSNVRVINRSTFNNQNTHHQTAATAVRVFTV